MSILQPPYLATILSGEWVGLQEALGWVQTRDAAFAAQMQEESALGRVISLAYREVVESAGSALDDEDQACLKLLQVLRHGIVAAHGRRDTPSAQSEPISTVEWSGLRFGAVRGSMVAMPLPNRAGGSVWFDIVFQSATLVSAIPEPRLFGGLAEALAARLAEPSAKVIEHEAPRAMTSDAPEMTISDEVAIAAVQVVSDHPPDAEVQSTPTGSKRRRGAPSMEAEDAKAIDFIRKLVLSGVAVSKAADSAVKEPGLKVAGYGNDASRSRRLRERYMKAYPTE